MYVHTILYKEKPKTPSASHPLSPPNPPSFPNRGRRKSLPQRIRFLRINKSLQHLMRAFHHVIFDALFEKQSLAEHEAGQADDVLMRAAGDGAEFGLEVDLGGEVVG